MDYRRPQATACHPVLGPPGSDRARAQTPSGVNGLGKQRELPRRGIAGTDRHHDDIIPAGRLPCDQATAREDGVVEMRGKVEVQSHSAIITSAPRKPTQGPSSCLSAEAIVSDKMFLVRSR